MFVIRAYKFTLRLLLKSLNKAAEAEDKKSELQIKAAVYAEAQAVKLRAVAAEALATANKFREEGRKVSALI